jgi:hypothetical protein
MVQTVEKQKYITPKDLWAFGIPVGAISLLISAISDDEKTVTGLQHAQQATETGGIAILEHHRAYWDTLFAAVQTVHNLQLTNLVVPIAAKHSSRRVVQYLVGKMNATGAEMITVYRREEKKKIDSEGGEHDKAFGLTKVEMDEKNEHYTTRTQTAATLPHHGLLIAPYGTRAPTADDKIRGGVIELLRKGVATLFTYVEPQQAYPFFKVFLSADVMNFEQVQRRKIVQTIVEQRKELVDRAKTLTK